MEQLNLNLLLDRENNEQELIDCLNNFEENKQNVLTKRGMYVYGAPGTGKTIFVRHILKKLNYDIIKFDAGDVRNKTIVDKITKHNMSDKNVLSLLQKKQKKDTHFKKYISRDFRLRRSSLWPLDRPRRDARSVNNSRFFLKFVLIN